MTERKLKKILDWLMTHPDSLDIYHNYTKDDWVATLQYNEQLTFCHMVWLSEDQPKIKGV
jgi:hypothetical protein